MAIKTKNSETPAQVSASPVEKAFSEGLEYMNSGKLAEAAKAFEFVQTQAAAEERLNLCRTARGYLAAIQARLASQVAPEPVAPEMAAQILLNDREAEGALELVEKALAGNPDRAILHYLAAMAHAQLDQAEACAEALTKAVNLDPDFLFQFRLESDFDGLRHQAAFAALLKG